MRRLVEASIIGIIVAGLLPTSAMGSIIDWPTALPADGIGPGTRIQIPDGVDSPPNPTIAGSCSSAFLLREPGTWNYFLSTAGHCVSVDLQDLKATTGTLTPSKVKAVYDLCYADCLSTVSGGLSGQYLRLRPTPGYHPVSYGIYNTSGDFALLSIPESENARLRAAMPQWGGPSAAYRPANLGEPLVFYGWGEPHAFPTAARSLVSIGGETGVGNSYSGDSGAAISIASIDPATGQLRGTHALGVIVRVGISLKMSGTQPVPIGLPVPAPIPVVEFSLLGPSLQASQTILGFVPELVTADDPILQAPDTYAYIDPRHDGTVVDKDAVDAIGLTGRSRFAPTARPGTTGLEWHLRESPGGNCGGVNKCPVEFVENAVDKLTGEACPKRSMGPEANTTSKTSGPCLDDAKFRLAADLAETLFLDPGRISAAQLQLTSTTGTFREAAHDVILGYDGPAGEVVVARGAVGPLVPVGGRLSIPLTLTQPQIPAGHTVWMRYHQTPTATPAAYDNLVLGGADASRLQLAVGSAPERKIVLTVDGQAHPGTPLPGTAPAWSGELPIQRLDEGPHTVCSMAVQPDDVSEPMCIRIDVVRSGVGAS